MAVQDTIGNGVWNIKSAEVYENASNFVHIDVNILVVLALHSVVHT